MKKITDIKEGDWLPMDELIKMFPGLTKKTVYGWRAKVASGEKSAGDYPRSIKLGSTLYFMKAELIDFMNREISKLAS